MTYLDLAQIPNRIVILKINILVYAVGYAGEEHQDDGCTSQGDEPYGLILAAPLLTYLLQRN